ncbi:hypothetical protein ACM66B_006581 [Microbotryomycetes sp. NB124-2]
MINETSTSPRLPLELVQVIVDMYNLPTTFFEPDDEARQARQALASLSLTCRALAAFVRPILWSNVTLSNVNQLESFLSTTEAYGTPTTGLADACALVNSIRIGHVTNHMLALIRGDLSHHKHREQLKEVFKRCSNVKELRLAGLKQASTTWIVPSSDIESLFLLNCSIDASTTSSSPPPLLPNLRNLYISDNFFLRSLAFALNHIDIVQQPSTWTLTTLTAPVLNQLRSLSTSEELDKSLRDTGIEFLDCWYDEVKNEQSLKNLPRRLRYLRLNESPLLRTSTRRDEEDIQRQSDHFAEAWSSLREEDECLTLLERLWVPREWRTSRVYDLLRTKCSETGVKITYEDRRVEEGDAQSTEDAAFDRMFWRIAEQVERESRSR